MGNTRAEWELGREITRRRAAETERLREAFAQKQQADRDEEEARRQEIFNLGRGYQEPAPPAPTNPPPEAPKPLPPPTEAEIQAAVSRRSAKVKS